MPSDTRLCHARTRSSGDIFGSSPRVSARRGNQPRPFESTRKPFLYPGISSNSSAGVPWTRPASSVAIPISSSALAPRTTRSSPMSSIRLSQSRRSRKVRVGRSAIAMPISRPRPCRARGPIGKWLYHWKPSPASGWCYFKSPRSSALFTNESSMIFAGSTVLTLSLNFATTSCIPAS